MTRDAEIKKEDIVSSFLSFLTERPLHTLKPSHTSKQSIKKEQAYVFCIIGLHFIALWIIEEKVL
jgi:hypothetical protein